MNECKRNAIIIGAGPAGLSCAYYLLKNSDIKPVILEESSYIGGISRTHYHNGNRMDLGGHRFFTKNDEVMKFWTEIFPEADIFTVSALQRINVDTLCERIIELLPVCPPYFPKDALTDRPMRFFVSELIREQILLQYQKEIPYSVEVVVESYKEDEKMVRIGTTLYVERDTQKAIIIGKKGAAIKKLGIESRTAIEDFLQKHVFLDISVKVLKDWRNSELQMRRFGYDFRD